MPPKKQRGLAVPSAGLARRFSRAALTFLWWWAVVGSSPLLLAATFTTPVTISESDMTYDGQDIVVNGATLTVNGPHSFASLLLTNAAVPTHSPCTVHRAWVVAQFAKSDTAFPGRARSLHRLESLCHIARAN